MKQFNFRPCHDTRKQKCLKIEKLKRTEGGNPPLNAFILHLTGGDNWLNWPTRQPAGLEVGGGTEFINMALSTPYYL
jgi:hypothetical protein